MFSTRLPLQTEPNALSRALERMRADGAAYIDLTETNPTRIGLEYPPELLAGLADARALVYEPHPFGLLSAREAVAADCARRGAAVRAEDVVLTASTSEAYAWLFKLLCNPGDAVLVPRPSYPLFEHLTALESVEAAPYDLEYHGRWSIDGSTLARAPARTRAVIVVSPNNPTGSFLLPSEMIRLSDMCRSRGWALIVDEVFADYPLETRDPLTDVATRVDVPAFTLSGASKSLGLPQVKLGWMVIGGPLAARDAARDALAFIADAYLSVNTPVQVAAAELFRGGALVRRQIQTRLRENLATAHRLVTSHASCDLLPVEGGWSAIVRVPSIVPEERLVLDLLERTGVLVHPGYFFDFIHGCHIVISLLPPPGEFECGLAAALDALNGQNSHE
jgi:aspartate/methionine/tyrosine aminotransferase